MTFAESMPGPATMTLLQMTQPLRVNLPIWDKPTATRLAINGALHPGLLLPNVYIFPQRETFIQGPCSLRTPLRQYEAINVRFRSLPLSYALNKLKHHLAQKLSYDCDRQGEPVLRRLHVEMPKNADGDVVSRAYP